MISYIKGILADVFSDRVVVENNGIGYEVLVPGSLTARMPLIGEAVQLYTYLYVREDAMLLYGFFSRDDLEVFKLLIGVSGIGPKGALGILSVISPRELCLAVAEEDAKMIASAPGVGLKTAKKLIIELKDKLKEEGLETIAGDLQEQETDQNQDGDALRQIQKDAVEALTALGYGRSEAAAAVRKASEGWKETAEETAAAGKDTAGKKRSADQEEMDLELLLRQALTHLL